VTVHQLDPDLDPVLLVDPQRDSGLVVLVAVLPGERRPHSEVAT
jgi:hypothetical protein